METLDYQGKHLCNGLSLREILLGDKIEITESPLEHHYTSKQQRSGFKGFMNHPSCLFPLSIYLIFGIKWGEVGLQDWMYLRDTTLLFKKCMLSHQANHQIFLHQSSLNSSLNSPPSFPTHFDNFSSVEKDWRIVLFYFTYFIALFSYISHMNGIIK